MLGLRTVIYRVSDLERAKRWYARAFEVEPYFAMPFDVGFNIGGYELGLDPDLSEGPTGPGSSVADWGVAEIETAFERFVSLGATVVIAVVENPNFALP